MTQRVTRVINDKLIIKLRNLQAKKLKESHKLGSYSKMLNGLIERFEKTVNFKIFL
jgi:hypothetical protein